MFFYRQFIDNFIYRKLNFWIFRFLKLNPPFLSKKKKYSSNKTNWNSKGNSKRKYRTDKFPFSRLGIFARSTFQNGRSQLAATKGLNHALLEPFRWMNSPLIRSFLRRHCTSSWSAIRKLSKFCMHVNEAADTVSERRSRRSWSHLQ